MQCLHGQIILRELRQDETVVYRVKVFLLVQKHGTHVPPLSKLAFMFSIR